MFSNFNKELSDTDFSKLSQFIYSNYGIKMPLEKKGMLQARLQKRLKLNNFDTFKEYCDFVLLKKNSEEIVHMIDAVSTNKTDFFREPAHFTYLESYILPQYIGDRKKDTFNIWSSACSSGEEMYTIAMVISEFIEKHGFLNYSILGSDISNSVLEKAKNAVYSEDRILPIPLELRKKYLLRSINSEKKEVRIIPEIRNKTSHKRINLMDNHYNAQKEFDMIFCRNALIYFDRETQENVINKLCSHLKIGGYFFLGHSESITGINAPLKMVKPTIYVKQA